MLNNLAKLHAECFPHKPWTATDFEDLKKSGCDIIASENGFIVWRTVCDECELISIGVAGSARRTGIASAMLAIMENDARKNGAKKIFLDVAENNTAARTLYENNGYTEIGRRSKYYSDGIAAILMEKIL